MVGTANGLVLQRNKMKPTAEQLCTHMYVRTVQNVYMCVHACTSEVRSEHVQHTYLHSDCSPHLLLPYEVHEDPLLVHILARCPLYPQGDSGREEEGLGLAGGYGVGWGD